MLCRDSLVIETLEVVDTQTVDIGIVCDPPLREILAEIEAVGANSPGKFSDGQAMLQVELCVDAVLLQQWCEVVVFVGGTGSFGGARDLAQIA